MSLPNSLFGGRISYVIKVSNACQVFETGGVCDLYNVKYTCIQLQNHIDLISNTDLQLKIGV